VVVMVQEGGGSGFPTAFAGWVIERHVASDYIKLVQEKPSKVFCTCRSLLTLRS